MQVCCRAEAVEKLGAAAAPARLDRSMRLSGALRAHSSQGHQLSSRHPQVRQREQRDDLRRVLGKPSVSNLRVAELPLDHPERVLDLGSHAGLELLDLLALEAAGQERVQRTALARTHGNVPLRPLCLGSLVNALVARVPERDLFLAVQQRSRNVDVVDVGRRAHHRARPVAGRPRHAACS